MPGREPCSLQFFTEHPRSPITDAASNLNDLETSEPFEVVEKTLVAQSSVQIEAISGHPQPKRARLLSQKPSRGKQKIPISFIHDRNRRCSTFCKRKCGLMKKAFELAELTGAEVLLLVASEKKHVYTFATNQLRQITDSEQGREFIRSCLHSPTAAEPSEPNPSSPIILPDNDQSRQTSITSQQIACIDHQSICPQSNSLLSPSAIASDVSTVHHNDSENSSGCGSASSIPLAQDLIHSLVISSDMAVPVTVETPQKIPNAVSFSYPDVPVFPISTGAANALQDTNFILQLPILQSTASSSSTNDTARSISLSSRGDGIPLCLSIRPQGHSRSDESASG